MTESLGQELDCKKTNWTASVGWDKVISKDKMTPLVRYLRSDPASKRASSATA